MNARTSPAREVAKKTLQPLSQLTQTLGEEFGPGLYLVEYSNYCQGLRTYV